MSLRKNRLAEAASPYLRQHAENPVDWYPWCPEALERARREDKPIFLSVGYAACHWCHVMERESFEDPDIARILNEHFINIKVDREERPDIDQLYMQAVVAMTGHGGWPMSVFLTPDLQPFYAGTYFPPQRRWGRPGFREIITALAQAWQQRRADILNSAQEITEHLRRSLRWQLPPGEPSEALLRRLVEVWQDHLDRSYGGLAGAPKFPHAMELRALLRAYHRWHETSILDMVRLTLDGMMRGGIYDHVGGGFHRYSTDERWLVPHFEKMLYDNALLALTYAEAWLVTGESAYRRVVEETLAWLAREMTAPGGAFYCSLDADSEGEEGKYYVWTAAELRHILGSELFDLVAYVYDVSEHGNWEGKTILAQAKPLPVCARLLRMSEDDLLARLAQARQLLLEARQRRVPPGRDDKILTAWNALTLQALALAGVLWNPRHLEQACQAADWILTHLRSQKGELYHACLPDRPPEIPAFLDDYALFADALITLHECTAELRWLETALALAEDMLRRFHDDNAGAFYYAQSAHEPLLFRQKDAQDNATPSGNSAAAWMLMRLWHYTARQDFLRYAEEIFRWLTPLAERMPTAFGHFLGAVDFALGPVQEMVWAGPFDDTQRAELRPRIWQRFAPRRVLAWIQPQVPAARYQPFSLLADKTAAQQPTLYVCENGVCQRPIVGLEAIHNYFDQTSANAAEA
ncbi:MAG: thioredoxin domain-containing protein [Gemmatales bacterium]|nr:thioredoxin domain-containing protein [Gemmatales bacterium]